MSLRPVEPIPSMVIRLRVERFVRRTETEKGNQMHGRVIRIERISSRAGVIEEPAITSKGYQLADAAHGKNKHHAELAVSAKSLDEVVVLINKGFSLWMGAKGKRASLIAPGSLRIVRSEDGNSA